MFPRKWHALTIGAMLIASCGSTGEAGSDTANTGPEVGSTTTRAGFEPPENYRADEMTNLTPIPPLLGMPIDEAAKWARDRGWTEIIIIDVDADSDDYNANLQPDIRIIIKHQDEVVVEATAG